MTLQKFDSNKDYYGVLGVPETASADDLDRAYRGEARKRHPDGGGSEEEMKSLNEAHDILSDPETRKAYDAERRPRSAVYQSSMAFDPEAASRAGTLKIPVSDPDMAGLVMGAFACFGLGIPLLLLVEMQWMFFLWPLRIMALGAVAVGVYLSHAAMVVKQRKRDRASHADSRKLAVIQELMFWLIAIAVIGSMLLGLYVLR
jgi:curved DNA-binding protein CbpA